MMNPSRLKSFELIVRGLSDLSISNTFFMKTKDTTEKYYCQFLILRESDVGIDLHRIIKTIRLDFGGVDDSKIPLAFEYINKEFVLNQDGIIIQPFSMFERMYLNPLEPKIDKDLKIDYYIKTLDTPPEGLIEGTGNIGVYFTLAISPFKIPLELQTPPEINPTRVFLDLS